MSNGTSPGADWPPPRQNEMSKVESDRWRDTNRTRLLSVWVFVMLPWVVGCWYLIYNAIEWVVTHW